MLNPLSLRVVAEDVNRICRYLAMDDFEHKAIRADDIIRKIASKRFDVIAVFGNQVLATFTKACSLVRAGFGNQLLFSGGHGHSTAFLLNNIAKSLRYGHLVGSGAIESGSSEADMFAVMAEREFGIPAADILIENASRNTGENARFSLDLLSQLEPAPSHMLVLQDPILQRRTMLTLSLALESSRFRPLVVSHAALVPQLEITTAGEANFNDHDATDAWDIDRFLALVLGEIRRIRNDKGGYGPKGRGFIPAIELPDDVLSSYQDVLKATHSEQSTAPKND